MSKIQFESKSQPFNGIENQNIFSNFSQG